MDSRGKDAKTAGKTSERSQRRTQSDASVAVRGPASLQGAQHASSGVPLLPPGTPGSKADRHRCVRRSLIVARTLQIIVCLVMMATCAASTADLARLYKGSSSLLVMIMIVLVIMSALNALLDLMWLLLLVRPAWRAGRTCALGCAWKQHTCDLIWDMICAGFWLAMVASCVMTKYYDWKAFVEMGSAAVLHLLSAGLTVPLRVAAAAPQPDGVPDPAGSVVHVSVGSHGPPHGSKKSGSSTRPVSGAIKPAAGSTHHPAKQQQDHSARRSTASLPPTTGQDRRSQNYRVHSIAP